MCLPRKDSLLKYIYHLTGKPGSMQALDTCTSLRFMQPRQHWKPYRGFSSMDIRSISNSMTTSPSQMYMLRMITIGLPLGLVRTVRVLFLALRSYQDLDNLSMIRQGRIRPHVLQRNWLKPRRCLIGIMKIQNFLRGILLLSQNVASGHLALIFQHLALCLT